MQGLPLKYTRRGTVINEKLGTPLSTLVQFAGGWRREANIQCFV